MYKRNYLHGLKDIILSSFNNIIYKRLVITNGQKVLYKTTRYSVMRAIKDALYGFNNKEKYSELAKFGEVDKIIGLKVKLIGIIWGNQLPSKIVQQYIDNKY